MRVLIAVLSVSIVAVGAVVAVSIAWNDRAEDICSEEGARSAYSVTWEWSEFAYVCDYRAQEEEPKRVGIIDAFHGEGRRHGPDR